MEGEKGITLFQQNVFHNSSGRAGPKKKMSSSSSAETLITSYKNFLDPNYNKFTLQKFGDDAVDVIYEHLSPHDLVCVCRVSRAMAAEMARLGERLVNRLKTRYFNSRHVRVPKPLEFLHQQNRPYVARFIGPMPGVFAGSYLRQLRDMTKQRNRIDGW